MKESARQRMMCWALLLVAVAIGGAAMVEWKENAYVLSPAPVIMVEPAPVGDGEGIDEGEPEESRTVVPPRRVRAALEQWTVPTGKWRELTIVLHQLHEKEIELLPASPGEEHIVRAMDGSVIDRLPEAGVAGVAVVLSIEEAERVGKQIENLAEPVSAGRSNPILVRGAPHSLGERSTVEMAPGDEHGKTIDIRFETESEARRLGSELTVWNGQTVAFVERPRGTDEVFLYLIEASLAD